MTKALEQRTYTREKYLKLETASGEKFSAYRTVESFREYLLIDQYHIHIEHYVKTAAHQWLLSEYDDPNVTLTLSAFEAQIEIIALYDNIEIDA